MIGAAPADRSAPITQQVTALTQACTQACVAAQMGDGKVIGLRRLTGGASKETWSFDFASDAVTRPLILRRVPAGARPGDPSIDIETEADLLRLAAAGGVPVPRVLHVLRAHDGAGRGYIMERIEGETLARRVIRDPAFAVARARFTHDAGTILARIHALDGSQAELRSTTPADEVEDVAERYRRAGQPRPVFELAIRWLNNHLPAMSGAPKLVHGDFRNGNFIFGAEGIRAILDWELAHRGDPLQDLAWICINSWRFGAIDRPAGGIGDRESLYEAYETASGRPVDRAAVHFWEVQGTLRWGTFCAAAMLEWGGSGADRSVERLMIARRASETEIDLLRLLLPRGKSFAR